MRSRRDRDANRLRLRCDRDANQDAIGARISRIGYQWMKGVMDGLMAQGHCWEAAISSNETGIPCACRSNCDRVAVASRSRRSRVAVASHPHRDRVAVASRSHPGRIAIASQSHRDRAPDASRSHSSLSQTLHHSQTRSCFSIRKDWCRLTGSVLGQDFGPGRGRESSSNASGHPPIRIWQVLITPAPFSERRRHCGGRSPAWGRGSGALFRPHASNRRRLEAAGQRTCLVAGLAAGANAAGGGRGAGVGRGGVVGPVVASVSGARRATGCRQPLSLPSAPSDPR